MPEFRCKWSACPTAHNIPQVNFVEAPDVEIAKAVLRDYIERERHVEWYQIQNVIEYERPTGGRVL